MSSVAGSEVSSRSILVVSMLPNNAAEPAFCDTP